MGLHRAGFEVVGVDHLPQPRYPFAFIQADALRPPVRLEDFDLIWASPPCQAYSIANTRWGYEYPDLIEATRALLAEHPCSVIENVATAPIRADVVLVGSMFDLDIARRRHFEIKGFRPPFALIPHTTKTTMNGGLACVAGRGANRGRWKGNWSSMPAELRATLSKRNCKAGWEAAMGIDWMRRDELAQAIPPAYATFIAEAFLASERGDEHRQSGSSPEHIRGNGACPDQRTGLCQSRDARPGNGSCAHSAQAMSAGSDESSRLSRPHQGERGSRIGDLSRDGR